MAHLTITVHETSTSWTVDTPEGYNVVFGGGPHNGTVDSIREGAQVLKDRFPDCTHSIVLSWDAE
jgi:hypothetical protein